MKVIRNRAMVGGLVLLTASAWPTHADTKADLAAMRRELAKKDAEIARLRAELDDARRRLGDQQGTTVLRGTVGVNKPGGPVHGTIITSDQGSPQRTPAKPQPVRWNTRYVFTGKRIEGSPEMCYYDNNNGGGCRTLPVGASGEDYALAFCDICKQLNVKFHREGTTVYIVGALAGHAPVATEVTTIDEHISP